MPRKIIFFFVFGFLAFSLVSITSAIDLGSDLARDAATKAGYSKTTSETTFAETLGLVVKAALSFVGVIFLSLMVYAGFLWLNSKGDESQIDKAKEIIKAAIIGLIITVGAYSITAFVVPRVLERTAGPGGGDRTVGTESSIRGTCTYTVPGGTFDATRIERNLTHEECTNRCTGDNGYTECEFAGE